MVSVQPDGSLPGSTSEATADVPRGNPELDIPDPYSAPNRIGEASDSDSAWTTVEGVTNG